MTEQVTIDMIVEKAIFAERERCAKIVQGEVHKEHYRMWPQISTVGNRSDDSDIVKFCDKLAAAIRDAQGPNVTERRDMPDAEHVIVLRLMHLNGRRLTHLQKAREIIADLLVHGFKIVVSGEKAPDHVKSPERDHSFKVS